MSSIAINAGTSSRRGLRAGAFDVSQVVFAGGQRLRWHAHTRACVAVIVDGLVHKRFTGLAADAGVGTVVSMPPEEAHEDVFGRQGAGIVVAECDGEMDSVSCFRDWGALLVRGLRLLVSAVRGPIPAGRDPKTSRRRLRSVLSVP